MAKILLADDSGHAQRMGAKILSEEGHEVVTVGNGQAAIKSLEEWIPDLVIADIFMPGKNGFEVCQYVKSDSQRQHIPVLLLIGAMEPYDPEEGRKVHADGILTKPLKPTELISIVQQLLADAPKPAPPPARLGPQPKEATEEDTVEMETPFEAVSEPAEEMMEAAPAKEAEISEETGGEPEMMFGDLVETTEPEPAGTWGETALVEEEVAAPEPSAPAAREFEIEEQAVEQAATRAPAPWEIQTGETLQELVPTAPPPAPTPAEPPVRWTAEAVAVTAQDEKLFEQAAPDWNSLTAMAATEAEAPPAPQEKTEAAALEPEPFQAPALFPATEEAVQAAPAEPAALDPATVEPLVRQALEELLPEIVRRVREAVEKGSGSTPS